MAETEAAKELSVSPGSSRAANGGTTDIGLPKCRGGSSVHAYALLSLAAPTMSTCALVFRDDCLLHALRATPSVVFHMGIDV